MSGKTRRNSKRRRLFNERLEDRVMLTCNSGAGDFDGNGNLDHADVDALIAEMISGSNATGFDLTGDGLVNRDDLNDWVLNRKGTLLGDANLDFGVDVSDFGLWNANKFQFSGQWLAGDFNGDEVTDTSDFNLWNASKFQSADGPGDLTLGLDNDTGVSAVDGITSEIAVCGEYRSDQSPIVAVQLGLLGSNQVVDLPATNDGSFTFTRAQLESTFGPFDDGGYIFQLEVTDASGLTRSEILDVNLDTVATRDVVGPDFGLQGIQSSLDVVFGEQVDGSATNTAVYTLRKVGGPANGETVSVASVDELNGRAVRLNFDSPIEDSQSYRLSVAAGVSDLAGNQLGSFEFNFTVNESFALEEVVPESGAQAIALTQNIEIRLQEPVDPATVDSDSIKLITLGNEATGRYSVNADGDTVYFFPDQPWAASAEVRVQIDGDRIATPNGTLLDADGDGFAGGVGNFDFTTVSVSQIAGTMVVGRVVASEPDAMGNDLPLEGVTVRVDGFPELDVTTNHNGEFVLENVPSPGFFVHIDGSTTQFQAGDPVPAGGYFPNIAKEFDSIPGQRTNIPFNIHLPFVLDEAISDVQPNQSVTVTLPDVQTQNDPELAMVSLTVPANSLVNEDGSAGTEVGIFRVDSSRLPAPLPGNLDHSFDITVQADAPIFDQPAEITFPNTEGLAPGEQSLLMSFDHARAEWIVVGSLTVSADGETMTSDPDSGVRAPGWHGVQRGVSVTTEISTPKPPARGRLESALALTGNASRTFLASIGVVASVADQAPIIGQAPVVDQGLSLVSGVTVTAARWTDGDISEADVTAALLTANALNPEPISGTAVDAAQLAVAVDGVTNGARSTFQSAQDLLGSFGLIDQDWSDTIEDITDRAVAWGENFGLMLDGAIQILNALESDPSGQLATTVDEVVDGLAKIGRGRAHFLATGEILDSINQIGASYTNWLEHFEEVYAGFFESGSSVPYLVTDRAGNFVTRGVSDADGTFSVVLPANEVFNFTVVDPLRGWGTTQTVVTGDNGTRQSRTALILPTDFVDTDMDGLSDTVENVLGTNPDNPDSDGDGVLDGGEVRQGLNPLDARGFPTGVISNLPLQGSASDIVTASRPDDAEDIRAYVATGAQGLVVMDISQFDDPILLGQIDLPGVNQGVAISSDRTLAAVAGGSGGLHLVDVSEPMMPELIRTVSLGGSVTNVEISNGLVYASIGRDLVAVDLVSGEQIESLNLGTNITDISRDGSMLYTMNSSRALSVIDVSSFAMVTRGSLVLPNGGGKLFVGGGIAYASNVNPAPGGFVTVDVSDPEALTLISDVDIPAGTDGPEGPIAANGSGLAVQGGRIIRDSVLNVFDVSDPTNTDDFLTQFDLPRVPTGISLAGGIAIVSDGTSGVQVVNFLPFDSAEVAPTVTVQPDFVDVDGGVAGIQVVEGTSLPFKLDVTDDVQVRSVELLVDGVPFASDITFPYELTTPGISATAGNRLSTQIRVTDGGGNSTVSDPIIVDLVPDTVAPSILLQDPEPNSERSRLQRQFRITFDEPMNVNTLTTDNFQMFDPAGNLIEPELIQVGFNDTSVTLSYPEMVEGSHQFRINEAMITDRVGNRLGSTTTVSTFDVLTSTAFWIGASGNFNDPSNWSNGVVPGPTDDVLISVPGDQTITVNAAHTLLGLRSFERFNIIGGSLQVTVQGQLFAGLEMSGGTAGGSAPLEVYGDSTFGGGAIVGFGGLSNMGQMEIQNNPTISGVFTNAGNVIHTASDLNFNSATVRNLSDAIYEIRSGQLDANAGFWNFENEGTIRKTSEETVNFDVNVLQSGGTIEVVEGNLNLIRGGQHLTGHYRVAADAVLNYANGTYDFFGLATGDGDGIINVQSTWRVPDGEIATLDFEGDVLQWNSTSFQLNQGLENLGEINLINGPSLSGVLNNRGTINHSASDLNFNSATINNLPGGVYEIRSGQLDANSGFWNFNNEGTIRKVGDTTALVDVFLSQQTGIVDIQEGQLDLTRGGVHTGGTYSVAADAILNYANGTYAFVGLVSPTGEGTVNVNSTWNVPLDTTATLNFPGDLLQWNTTTYDLDGPLSNIGTINWNGNPSFNGILNNEGLIVHNASDLNFNSATINNRPGGVYEIRSGQLDANTGFWNFNNEGTIRKVGDNTASFDVFLSQQAGVVDIQEGQLNLTRGGSHTGGTYAIAANTVLNYQAGTYALNGMVSSTGAGTVNVNTTWNVPLDATATLNFPGDLLQWNTTTYDLDGPLSNIGTINWNGSPSFNGILNNEGLIVHDASDLNFNSATINNLPGGVYEIRSGQLDANSGFWNFNNEGTIRKVGDNVVSFDVFLSQQAGVVDIREGQLNLTRSGSHTGGTYSVAEDASLNYVNGTFTFDGMVSPTGNGTVNVNSTWSVPTGVEAIVNFPDDMLQWNSTSYNFDGLLTNLGTVNWNGSSFLRGTLDNEGLIVHNASDLNFNSATINNRAGSTYEIQSGQLDANSGFWNFNNDGTIRVPADAAGTMDVFVTNNGLIELLEGGALNFTRGLVLGNESRIFSQIGGTSSSEFGKLATNAGLTLAGTLEVDTVGGFAPAGGDSFRVVAYTSSSGDFSSFDDNGTGLGYALNATGVDVGLGLAIASTRSEAEFSEEEDRGVERVKRLVELVFADFNE